MPRSLSNALANENITVDQSQIKAFTATSFGFGQKGPQVIVVYPRYLYAAISEPEYSAYRTKQTKRTDPLARTKRL